MTRKHFNELAYQLGSAKPMFIGGSEWHQWQKCCEAVARACKQFNGAFDYCRFLKACGYYEKEEKHEPVQGCGFRYEC